MKLSVLLVTGFGLLLSGCESSQDMFRKKQDANEALLASNTNLTESELGIRCEMMSRTGSNKKTKVCRTSEQMKKDKIEADRAIQRLQKSGVTRDN
ncbi:hypothetical protein PULV_a3778 [Pseudoalteromonas ulvae UL12]|uniref:Lipoprotein n=1 Tax=Pseudoalteromonas ulvae TaxID=107327 RepID=A0A244CKN6_PSEDV|nr:hypothetical protein [Pseudoalteromonas ulvae]MBE0362086.1 hypothetical protein [Pseudoalteromonas ulvae UL12]OUL55934.1 hypothetical protein B1199_19705 [Pseudoalteromonas ulvae]